MTDSERMEKLANLAATAVGMAAQQQLVEVSRDLGITSLDEALDKVENVLMLLQVKLITELE